MASGGNVVIRLVTGYVGKGVDMFKSAMASTGRIVAGIGRNLANIHAGFTMLANSARATLGHLEKAFKFETMTVQFKRLVGGIDEAREHMAMLQEMGNTPPFSLEQFVAASRSMMIMSDGALGYKQSLELVGDAAAATGQPIESLAQEVGRAYAVIRAGQPLTLATRGLRHMGAITPEVAAKLGEMQNAGASNLEIWQTLTKELEKFKGAMADTEDTGEGLIGAISSQWDNVVRSFGAAFMDAAKGGMQLILEKMKELRDDGSIELWASKAKDAVEEIVEAIKALAPAVTAVWKSTVFAFKAVGSELGRFAGAVSMGNVKDAFTGIGTETARAYTEVFDPEGAQARKDAKVKGRAAEKRKANAATEANRDAEVKAKEDERVRKQMADARAKADERAEKERAAFKKSLANDVAKAELDAEEKAHMAEMNANDEFARRRKEQAEEYLAKLRDVTDKKAKAELDQENSLANARIDMEERVSKERKRVLSEHVRQSGKIQMAEVDKQISKLKLRVKEVKKGIERTEKGKATDARYVNGVFGPYQYGERSGGGESFTDWSRADRFAGRADRDAAKAARRDAAAQKRFDRIRDRLENGESVSGADEKFYDRFKAFQDQKGNAEKLEKSLESAQQKRDELQKEMQKTLEEINQNIKDALAVG